MCCRIQGSSGAETCGRAASSKQRHVLSPSSAAPVVWVSASWGHQRGDYPSATPGQDYGPEADGCSLKRQQSIQEKRPHLHTRPV